jgi:NADH:ubiquinone oxidoreductase subunit E
MPLKKILLSFKPEPDNLLPALKEIQKRNQYVSQSDCEEVAEYFSLPLARIFSAASFFDEIRTEKSRKKIIRVCSGGPCLEENSVKVVRQIERLLGIEAENDSHPKYKLEYMSCRGLCDEGPVVELNGNIFEKVKPENVDDILKNYI